MALRNRRKGKAGIAAMIVLIVAAVLLVIYIAGIIYFQKHFILGTEINGVNCSMKSVAGAENKITDVVQNFGITVKERQKKTETLNGKEFSMDVVFDDSMNSLLQNQNVFSWPVAWRKIKNKSIGVTVSFDEAMLKKAVLALDAMQQSNMQEPVNASLNYDSTKKQFVIVPEEEGTTIDVAKIQAAAKECVENLNEEMNLEELGCYVNPKYYQEDEAVAGALDTVNRYVSTEVTYDYETDKVVLTSDQIAQWLKISEDFAVSFDKDKVQEFVSSMAAKYDTIFTTREFKTSYDYTLKISKGDYGWWTNRVAERKDLIKFIKAGKSGTKEPVYYQRAAKRGEDDMGDTYVEVNLTKQHVLLYKDGKLVDQSDCVSGKTSSPTPAGIYSVTYVDHTYDNHQVELVGEDYSSKVDFFIPFSGNVGFHDASWRSSFGGNQYMRRGSHGCVNLPYHMAESIYNTMKKGLPVIVYEDPNIPSATTEAKTTESQN